MGLIGLPIGSQAKQRHVTFRLRAILAGRLTAACVAGLFACGLLGILGGPKYILGIIGVGVVLSWPMYLVALIVTIILADSIAARPALWCSVAVVAVSVVCLMTLPFSGHIWSIATSGVLSAFVSALFFYCWNARSPLRPISN